MWPFSKATKCDHDWEAIGNDLTEEELARWNKIGLPKLLLFSNALISADRMCLKCGTIERPYSDCARKILDKKRIKEQRQKLAKEIVKGSEIFND